MVDSTPRPPANFPASWAIDSGEDVFGFWQAFEIEGVRQVMRWIAAGRFMMGSLEDETERRHDEILHTVTLSRGFWLAETACSQALWQVVIDPVGPEEGKARVLRGGDWFSKGRSLRSASRCSAGIDYRSNGIGLRLAGG